jgi:hypothetical protein
VYDRLVTPSIVTREMVGAHYAVSSLFESYPDQARIYSFIVDQTGRRLRTAGNARLAAGRLTITSTITRSAYNLAYAVLHMGDHNLNCGIRPEHGAETSERPFEDMCAAFERADFPEIIRLMDHHFGQGQYSIKGLFRDEQRKVLNHILATTREEIHNTYRLMTDRYAPLMRFLGDLGAATLPSLEMAMRFVLNTELRRQFESESLDIERVRSLLAEIAATKVPFDPNEIGYAAKHHLADLSVHLTKSPDDLALLKQLTAVSCIVRGLPFDVNLLQPQNDYYDLQQSVWPGVQQRATQGDAVAQEWLGEFSRLGEALGFQVEKPEPVPVTT